MIMFNNKQALSLISGLTISVITILATCLMVEGFLRWAWKAPYQWDRRLMFFSEGYNFRNTDWGGIAYQPNAVIRSKTYYITSLTPLRMVKEYDYTITSNSYGFVQLKELSAGSPSIIFLGNSFTEGQGARPWFYTLEAEWPKNSSYQIINGAIMAAGFGSWWHVYRELSQKINIAKAVVIFISDDWSRGIWQFSSQTLECLKAAARCEGWEGFYGLPENPIEARGEINRIARLRVDYLENKPISLRDSFVYRKLVLPALLPLRAKIGSIVDPRAQRFEFSKQSEFSKRAILNLVAELGADNVLFIHLPQKDEVGRSPTWYGQQADDFIIEKRFSFMNGFTKCGLTMRDYHKHDGHPNATGYAKIAACVERAVKDVFSPL
jgi:hypothetical protein